MYVCIIKRNKGGKKPLRPHYSTVSRLGLIISTLSEPRTSESGVFVTFETHINLIAVRAREMRVYLISLLKSCIPLTTKP